jgi:hypothetical protein
MADRPTLHVTGLGIGDVTFSNDRGVWNISRALQDCLAGKHSRYLFDVKGALENNEAVEVDEAKVLAFTRDPLILAAPLLLAIEDGQAWLIDGHHRLRALSLNKVKDFEAYVIEEEEIGAYIVRFNGERLPPWGASW